MHVIAVRHVVTKQVQEREENVLVKAVVKGVVRAGEVIGRRFVAAKRDNILYPV